MVIVAYSTGSPALPLTVPVTVACCALAERVKRKKKAATARVRYFKRNVYRELMLLKGMVFGKILPKRRRNVNILKADLLIQLNIVFEAAYYNFRVFCRKYEIAGNKHIGAGVGTKPGIGGAYSAVYFNKGI